jgi:hypothetical protein
VSDGQYVVEFPNLSDLTDKGGNFEVASVQTAHNCTITTFAAGTGGTAIVYVDCYLLGSLTDTYFDLTATRVGTIKHGLLDYAWVSSKNKSYKPSSAGPGGRPRAPRRRSRRRRRTTPVPSTTAARAPG